MVKLTKVGDTIVEVMICLAIVGFALSTSYGLVQSSVKQVRDAEERSQSLQLARQQIERLKELLAKHPNLKTAPPKNNDGTPGPFDYPDYILNPTDSALGMIDPAKGITAYRQAGSQVPYPGFCIYSDLTMYWTFDSTDPRCATKPDGEFYCENHPCDVNFPKNDDPGEAAVNNAGYVYRAGGGTLPLAIANINGTQLWCGPHTPPNHPELDNHCGVDDGFLALAGDDEVGGAGANTKKFSIVSIPYRIHQ